MSDSTSHTDCPNRAADKPRGHMGDAREGSLMSGDFSEVPAKQEDAGNTAPGSPALSIASAVVGLAGIVIALWVSWILSVAAGVVAIVLGRMAIRREAPLPQAAYAGQVLGFICVVANTVLMVFYIYQLMSLGLL